MLLREKTGAEAGLRRHPRQPPIEHTATRWHVLRTAVGAQQPCRDPQEDRGWLALPSGLGKARAVTNGLGSKHRASGHFSVERHTTDVRGGTLVTRDPAPSSGVVSEVSRSCGLLTEAAEVLPSALLVV